MTVLIWLSLVSFHFFMQDQRLNQFIEWRLSMYIIADPKMKKPTKCLSQAFTRG